MEKIIIIDFGSQVTQLIAKVVRANNVYSEIKTFNENIDFSDKVKGVIFSGSHYSVSNSDAPDFPIDDIPRHLPILGICYGAQLLSKKWGGDVEPSKKREYGNSKLIIENDDTKLFQSISSLSQVWMSHSDTIQQLGDKLECIAKTESIPIAAFESNKQLDRKIFGVQFHPEVTHTIEGKTMIKNFLCNVCSCSGDWTSSSFIHDAVDDIRKKIPKDKKVIMALSGGVDSTVAAVLIDKAIHQQLKCIFINNGLLRKNEFEDVLNSYKHLRLNVQGIDASQDFLSALKGISDPEEKRKIIGRKFIDIFETEANKDSNVAFLGQGTIYPDVIESKTVHSESSKIKSHHNVGGLPEKMHLTLVEPLRQLFKDEVRTFGKGLNIPDDILMRHPFPGPGLAIRILGAVTQQKVSIVQEADAIFISELKKNNFYNQIWQAGVMLLPIMTVGVMGDSRTYEYVIALRAVESVDGMTADWGKLDQGFLSMVANKIINNVKGVNRVVYDITSKPPGTIEWE